MTGLLNSFQVFNIYIDRAMELLTDSEFRVLMYATRHITGWQDRIEERQGCLSISMFERGFITKDGNRFAGCGLGRQTIINAIGKLVEYGFLERAGKATAKGQKYTLQTNGIDWNALIVRHAEKLSLSKKRTANATISRLVGTSDDTGTLDVTMQGTSDVTMLSTLDVTQTKTSSNPPTKTKTPRSNAKAKKTPLTQLQGRLQPYTVLAAALLDLFDAGYKQAIHKPEEYLITLVQLEKYVPILEDLGALKATADEVYAVHKYLKPGYTKNGWTIGLKTIVEKLPAFRVWRDNGGEKKIITGVWGETDAPEIKDVGLTPEQRKELINSTKKAVSA